jgi:hypothetical protein
VQIPGLPERGLPIVPQSIGPPESTPYLNELLQAGFSVYQGDEPLLPGFGLRTGTADTGTARNACT